MKISVGAPEVQEAVDALLKLWRDEYDQEEQTDEGAKKHYEELMQAVATILALDATPFCPPKITIEW